MSQKMVGHNTYSDLVAYLQKEDRV
jgi:hypothetical protein